MIDYIAVLNQNRFIQIKDMILSRRDYAKYYKAQINPLQAI